MIDVTGHTSRRRRHLGARWLAWWRFRRRAELVDETPAGEPVLLIGTARLVLEQRDGRRVFRRLAPCALCHRETVWHDPWPLRRPADLHRYTDPVICAHCVAAALDRPERGPWRTS